MRDDIEWQKGIDWATMTIPVRGAIVIRGGPLSREQIGEMRQQITDRGFESTLLLVLGPDHSIEMLSASAMARYGWYRRGDGD